MRDRYIVAGKLGKDYRATPRQRTLVSVHYLLCDAIGLALRSGDRYTARRIARDTRALVALYGQRMHGAPRARLKRREVEVCPGLTRVELVLS